MKPSITIAILVLCTIGTISVYASSNSNPYSTPPYQVNDTSGSTPVTRITVDGSGNVGIGTTPTNFKLQVAGNLGPDSTTSYNLGGSSVLWNNVYVGNIAYIGGYASSPVGSGGTLRLIGNLVHNAGTMIWPNTDSASVLQFTDSGGTTYMDLDSSNRRVGIGNTSPQYPLDVKGTIGVSISSTQTVAKLYSKGGDGQMQLYTGNANPVSQILLNATGPSYFRSGEELGIGTTTPQYPLDISGNMQISGNIISPSLPPSFQAGSSTITLPSGTTTLAGLGISQTFTGNHQFTTTSLLLQNPAQTHATTLAGGAVTANQTLNMPAITGTDTVATLGLGQTFTGLNTFTQSPTFNAGITSQGNLQYAGSSTFTITASSNNICIGHC